MRTQRTITSLLVTAALALGAVTTVRAADKKADPNGTWSWTMQGGRGGQGGGAGGGAGGNANAPARKVTLKLKAEGEKLTGSVTTPAFARRGGQGGGGAAPAGEPVVTQISDGKVSGDEVSFSVKRDVGGNTMVQKYSGKIDGDTLKGKIESERNGQNQSRDWEAKREK